jgi:hypothetical protein
VSIRVHPWLNSLPLLPGYFVVHFSADKKSTFMPTRVFRVSKVAEVEVQEEVEEEEEEDGLASPTS